MPKAAQYCKALFDNAADGKYELSFKKNDRMKARFCMQISRRSLARQIIDKTFKGSADWWTCELDGRRGAVPTNYVVME